MTKKDPSFLTGLNSLTWLRYHKDKRLDQASHYKINYICLNSKAKNEI